MKFCMSEEITKKKSSFSFGDVVHQSQGIFIARLPLLMNSFLYSLISHLYNYSFVNRIRHNAKSKSHPV